MDKKTFNATIDKNEKMANRYTLNCMRTMTCITLFAFLLNVLDIFIIEQYLMYITAAGSVLCWFGSYLVVKFLNDRPETKYILFGFMLIFITIIGVTVTYHTILITAMPILCSVQYRNNKVVYFTYVLSVVSIFIGVMGGYYFGLCDANMLALTSTTTASYIDKATGLLTFKEPNPNPWGTLPIYYVFPRALVLYAFVPVMKHVTEVISKNAVREVELRRLSEIDSMTHLYNRNKYDQMMKEVYPKMEKLGVIFWDVNELKSINDNIGHEYGDFVISAVAGAIFENLPENTSAYRVGGDEFVVITEQADESVLQEMIRKTQESIERKNKSSKIKISAAYGSVIGEGKEIEKLIADADSRMYLRKHRQKEAQS